MDAKERIMKAINHEEADRVPTFEGSIDNLAVIEHYRSKYVFQGAAKGLRMMYYLSFGSNKLLTKILTFLGKRKSAIKLGMKPVVQLLTYIGIDLGVVPLALFPKKYFKNGYIDEFGRRFEFKVNPADGMDVSYYMGGGIKDFEAYEEFPKLDPDNPMRENAYKIGKKLEAATKGKLYLAPATFGLMESTWEGFGLENFARMLARPSQIKRIFDERGEFALEMTKRVIEWGEEDGAILFFDDYGYKKGLFMSPRNYRKYVFPWISRICNTAHKAGLKVIVHSCGDIYQILEDLINAGVDALNPIEPTTANPEYNIFKLKEKFGDKLCFIGNVSPQDLSDKDPVFIRDYTKRLLKHVAPGGGFILSSGHSINPAVKLENYLAMREIVDKYGNYPININ
ncbi:MAG: uroporphyrinogen decarboxylase family protein [Promethearchaeota archaeon]